MINYVNSMSALTGTSLWQIPYRDSIVLSMALVGVVCLVAAVALVAKADEEAELIAIRVEED